MKRILWAVVSGIGAGLLILSYDGFPTGIAFSPFGLWKTIGTAVAVLLGSMLASWKAKRSGWVFGIVVGLNSTVVILLADAYDYFFSFVEIMPVEKSVVAFLKMWISGHGWLCFLLIITSSIFGGWLGERLSKRK